MNEKTDLGQDLTIEELRSLYFDEDALRLPPIKLFRMDSYNKRIYYTSSKGVHEFFPGVTGFLSKVLPTAPELIAWKVQMGEGADDYVKERATYGSLMHGQFAPLLINRKYDLGPIREIIHEYCKEAAMIVDENAWTRELKGDIIAFADWMNKYQVKPLAIEVPLCTRKYGIATLIDLVCKMIVPMKGFWGEEYKSGARKGQPKETIKDCEIFAIIDFKSRKKAYVTETDELQLAYSAEMVKENYPEFKDLDFKLFSWHPKDWKPVPGSHFTEHTNKHSVREMELYSELYHLKNNVSRYQRMSFKGVVEVGKDLSENYELMTLMEIVELDKMKRIIDYCEGNTDGTVMNEVAIKRIIDICNQDMENVNAEYVDTFIAHNETEEGYLVNAAAILNAIK